MKKATKSINGFSAELYREIGEIKQSFKDHLDDHRQEHTERISRQQALDRRLDSIDRKLEEATEIKRGMAVLLKIAGSIATFAGMVLAFLKIKQMIK